MIKAVYIAEGSGNTPFEVNPAICVTNKGIQGDRNFARHDWEGQNITFIEAEEIQRFNNDFNQSIDHWDTRRNVVTEGVRLNDLVGKEFTIGEVRFRGVELCEPCAYLGGLLENESIAKKQLVKALVNRGGLYADILSDGVIVPGMTVDLA
ncbi:MAG: MOSC domain-containing protein YiiM [Saprospiraceae bacterium]|jgi:MOSC domain-containing protein YiiM